ncbi:MAG: rod shape-determining protein MreD [Deltaproteobacteria bacterium]|nr:rod shape-determining protein MreD [Deltaproteobacteria bacterium]
MKRSLTFLGFLLLLLSVQGVLVRSTGWRLDVATLAVVYLALERAVLPGAALAVASGYLSDVLAGTNRGLYAATGVIVFFVVRLGVSRLAGSGPLFVSLLGVLATALTLAVAVVIEALLGPAAHEIRGIAPAFLPLLGGAAVLSYPVYRLLKRIDERFKEPEDDLVFRP